MKKVILIVVGAIVFLAVLFILIPNILGIFSRDIASANDSDLQLSTISLPPAAENSFYDVDSLKVSFNSTDTQEINDMLAGKTWDKTAADRILASNSAALTTFDNMAQKPYFQDINFADPININVLTPITNVNVMRFAGELSALKAIELAKDGNGQAAFNEAEKSLQLGQNMENSQGSLIEYLVAMALKRIGLGAVEQILQSTSVPAQRITELDNFKENKNWIAISLKIQYKYAADAINMLASGNPDAYLGLSKGEFHPISNFYFKPNETKSYSADYYRAVIENSQKPCQEQIDIKPPVMVSSQFSNINDIANMNRFVGKLYLQNMFNENFIGKALYDVSAVDISNIAQASCKIDSQIEAIQSGNQA